MQPIKRQTKPLPARSGDRKRRIQLLQRYSSIQKQSVESPFDIAIKKEVRPLSRIGRNITANEHMQRKKMTRLSASETELDTLSIQCNARVDGIISENNNITNATRTIDKYEEVLEIKFAPFIHWHYHTYGPINILDAGCGNGVFSKELLASNHSVTIKKIYGVSLDKFTEAVRLSEDCSKFKFMHMPVEIATARLEGLGVKINIIFDVWGPFSYSLEKMDVLKKYYSLLQDGGRAFLFLGTCFTQAGDISAMPQISFKGQDNTATDPEDILIGLTNRYPETFKLNNKCDRSLIMRKNGNKSFPIDYEFEHTCSPMLGFSFPAQGASRQDMIEGNAAMPAEIIIRPKL